MSWQLVYDKYKRPYYWNTITDEVTWSEPSSLSSSPKVSPVSSPSSSKVLETWTQDIPCVNRQTYIRTRFSIFNSRVRLELKLCREQHTIIDRIWSQLTQKEKQFKELECIYRNNIVSKSIRIIQNDDLQFFIRLWKHNATHIQMQETQLFVLFFTRFKEKLFQQSQVNYLIKKISSENEILIKQLALCKLQLAECDYESLIKI